MLCKYLHKLGNQSSQWFALLYLNKIDHYIKEQPDNATIGLPLGYRNYNIMQTVIMKLCFLFYN